MWSVGVTSPRCSEFAMGLRRSLWKENPTLDDLSAGSKKISEAADRVLGFLGFGLRAGVFFGMRSELRGEIQCEYNLWRRSDLNRQPRYLLCTVGNRLNHVD